jgi:hypothetical protein
MAYGDGGEKDRSNISENLGPLTRYTRLDKKINIEVREKHNMYR